MKVVIGIGLTGLSCLRFLIAQGEKVAAIDSRESPPDFNKFQQEFPQIPYTVGSFDSPLLNQAQELIISPGVSLQEPPIAKLIAKGIPVIGDVELFARKLKKPLTVKRQLLHLWVKWLLTPVIPLKFVAISVNLS